MQSIMSTAESRDLAVPEDEGEMLAQLRRHGVPVSQRPPSQTPASRPNRPLRRLPAIAKALENEQDQEGHRPVNNGAAGARQRGAGEARPPVLLQLGQAAGSRTTVNRPGIDGGFQPPKDGSHGGTEEVPRRAA
jgi:hypothetical protein